MSGYHDDEYMNEEWKDIEGYDGRYQVSNHGRVKRSQSGLRYGRGSTFNGKILKQSIQTRGYKQVTLWNNKKNNPHTIHRLVLIAFKGHPPEGMECNHIDGNKTNNHISNLEWITPQQNTLHSIHILNRWYKGKKKSHSS